MVTSRSQLFAPTSSQIERAWHLLTILIRLGRPARPAELASRFALDSTSLSSDLVEFLCRIPGSPLFLTDDRLVTVSGVAVAAFGEFLVGAIPSFVPRVAIRVSEQRRDWGDLRLMYVRKRKVRPLGDGLVGPSAKRRLLLPSESDVEEELREDDGLRIQSSPTKALKVYFSVADILAEDSLSVGMSSSVLSQEIALTPSLQNSSILLSSFGNNDHGRRDCESEKVYDDTQAIIVHKELPELSSNKHGSLDCELNAGISEAVTAGRLKMSEPDTGPALLDTTKDKPVLWMETLGEGSCILTATPLTVRYEVNSTAPTFQEAKNESNVPSIEIGTLIGHTEGLKENEVATEANYCQSEGAFKAGAFRRDPEKSSLIVQTASKLESPAVSLSAEPATVLKHQRMSSEKPKVMDGIVSTVGLQSSVWESNKRRNGNLPKQEQAKRDEKGTFVKQKMKRSRNLNMPTKENRLEAIPKVSKSHSEPKLLPNFESFVIEEEEGSGGYGTVYRARRKEDGKIFALKYPHPNAHSHHVNNELKMLERFGGRNFVIKYEGSFRSGHSECFVLEHVEHDRPEVLKKEIDIFELQWYGYCMFRALASLHKQGIVHRDVKPGNFLFSRKLNKGYLIDFNLANDLHQKFSRNSRSGTASHVHLDPVSLPTMKSTSYTQARKVMNDGILDNISKEAANDSRKLILKNMKKRSSKGLVDTFPNIDSSNKYGSQAADASGVTSAKDPTSTRTPSADRLKQPMPCKGRKELISFVHEAMQSPNHQVVTGPASQRKRVAAPLGKVNRRLIILTPMPLHSGGNAVAGAGMFSRGNGKHKREGPCVGTKGFRAPEVLFKSYHQGCKVDIWSAGVTLLYLMIGRTPFGGDPEQNIKEIAKLRGSEDLWEVAKLHNCESSYPPDLFDVQSLQSMELREWCVMNTKRPEFLELVPLSLFDLVDRCLTVNPRRRITAEEALMHNFFTPCHESLRKQRLLRRAAGSESGSQSL